MATYDVDKKVLRHTWYLLGAPWASSDQAGMTILAGHPDPNIGRLVCDTQALVDDAEFEDEADDLARAIAAHIVDAHNEWLKRQPGIFKEERKKDEISELRSILL